MSFTPLHSFAGGLTLAFSVHNLLLQNGQVLGISGFFHRVIGRFRHFVTSTSQKQEVSKKPQDDGDSLAALFIAGLLAGGLALGYWEQAISKGLGVEIYDTLDKPMTPGGLLTIAVAGFLVGIGTKLGSGCTSGHFICGISRFSKRSFVATAIFFSVAVVTANILGVIPALPAGGRQLVWKIEDWRVLAALQAPAVVYALLAPFLKTSVDQSGRFARKLVSFTVGIHFAFGLAITGMLRRSKVLGFFALSPSSIRAGEWDPSLAFVALGAIIPSSISFFNTVQPRFNNGSGPTLGGQWRLPTKSEVDLKLIGGAALFGIGWGIMGVCPGPALVAIGWSWNAPAQWGTFIVASAIGGSLGW